MCTEDEKRHFVGFLMRVELVGCTEGLKYNVHRDLSA